MNNNLSLIGYRMPAEWELQESVWIAWPYNKSDWPGLFKNIPKIVTQIISDISRSQKRDGVFLYFQSTIAYDLEVVSYA